MEGRTKVGDMLSQLITLRCEDGQGGWKLDILYQGNLIDKLHFATESLATEREVRLHEQMVSAIKCAIGTGV